jgi:hypothetical protein
MSWATMTLIIFFFVDLGIFLLTSAYPAQYSKFNPPMIFLFQTLSGQLSWSALFGGILNGTIINPTAITMELVIVCGSLLVFSYLLNPQGLLAGQPFAVINLPLAIAISVFIVFLTVPNFSVIGIPSPLDIVIESIFGMLIGLSIFSFFKGE